MTVLDEKSLWVRFKDEGDDEAREELILEYMRIVKYVAGRMAIHVPSNVDMGDLVGWGTLGLLDAVEKFDHHKDVKFSTYATIRIRGAVIDEIRSLDWAPRSLRSMGRKVSQTRDKLRQEHGQEPSTLAIADELGTSVDQVEKTMSQLQTAHVLALDDYLLGDDDSDSRKADLTRDRAAEDPTVTAMAEERQAKLVEAILALPEQQQKVLNLYYYEELTLKEIGVVLEVSESRVCQIHSTAVKKLRKTVQEDL